MLTYRDFELAVLQLAVPQGRASNLSSNYSAWIQNALIKLQTYNRCLKDRNIDYYAKPDVTDNCNVSRISHPRGEIQCVFAFKPGYGCQKFYYTHRTPQEIERYVKHLTDCAIIKAGDGANCNANGYDYCYPPFIATLPEPDCDWKISEKIFAVNPNGELLLYPRFPCGYIVTVHWSGIKRKWGDFDLLPDDQDLMLAVANFVRGMRLKHLEQNESDGMAAMGDYEDVSGDMIIRCKKETEARDEQFWVSAYESVTSWFDGMVADPSVYETCPTMPTSTQPGETTTTTTTSTPPPCVIPTILAAELVALWENQVDAKNVFSNRWQFKQPNAGGFAFDPAYAASIGLPINHAAAESFLGYHWQITVDFGQTPQVLDGFEVNPTGATGAILNAYSTVFTLRPFDEATSGPDLLNNAPGLVVFENGVQVHNWFYQPFGTYSGVHTFDLYASNAAGYSPCGPHRISVLFCPVGGNAVPTRVDDWHIINQRTVSTVFIDLLPNTIKAVSEDATQEILKYYGCIPPTTTTTTTTTPTTTTTTTHAPLVFNPYMVWCATRASDNSFARFGLLNITTGDFVDILDTNGATYYHALTIDRRTNTLYASRRSASDCRLITLNKVTGAETDIASFGGGLIMRDWVWTRDNDLIGDGGTGPNLYEINPSTAAPTLINPIIQPSPLGQSPTLACFVIADDDSDLCYAIDLNNSGRLYRVNKNDGSTTDLGALSLAGNGVVINAAVLIGGFIYFVVGNTIYGVDPTASPLNPQFIGLLNSATVGVPYALAQQFAEGAREPDVIESDGQGHLIAKYKNIQFADWTVDVWFLKHDDGVNPVTWTWQQTVVSTLGGTGTGQFPIFGPQNTLSCGARNVQLSRPGLTVPLTFHLKGNFDYTT